MYYIGRRCRLEFLPVCIFHAPLKPRQIQSKCKAMEEQVLVCHLQYAADLWGHGARRSTDLADRYVSDRFLHSIWS